MVRLVKRDKVHVSTQSFFFLFFFLGSPNDKTEPYPQSLFSLVASPSGANILYKQHISEEDTSMQIAYIYIFQLLVCLNKQASNSDALSKKLVNCFVFTSKESLYKETRHCFSTDLQQKLFICMLSVFCNGQT